jgi:methylated-DNA-[protein]-cysteine S-methyltransferase
MAGGCAPRCQASASGQSLAGRGLKVGLPRPEAVYAGVIETPLPGPGARLGLVIKAGRLAAIDLLGAEVDPYPPVEPLAAEVARQIGAYFRDPAARFDLPLAPHGTEYQRRVWAALGRIPAGQPMTYGSLARQVGGSPRAVGGACRANPLPIIVPCHRVVAAGGRGGYMGETGGRALETKTWLLTHEAQADL